MTLMRECYTCKYLIWHEFYYNFLPFNEKSIIKINHVIGVYHKPEQLHVLLQTVMDAHE